MLLMKGFVRRIRERFTKRKGSCKTEEIGRIRVRSVVKKNDHIDKRKLRGTNTLSR